MGANPTSGLKNEKSVCKQPFKNLWQFLSKWPLISEPLESED